MTVSIPRSKIFPGFEVEVARHALEMRNWRSHMERVQADAKDPTISAIDRHVGHPMPSAHPMVEAAVNENDEADYTIAEDGPTPAQILQSKKQVLFSLVSAAEREANNAVIPEGRRRFLILKETDIHAAQREAIPQTIVAKISAVLTVTKPTLSAEDEAFLQDQSDRRFRMNAIERAAAKMHNDIEDLTIETVDAWVIPEFPK